MKCVCLMCGIMDLWTKGHKTMEISGKFHSNGSINFTRASVYLFCCEYETKIEHQNKWNKHNNRDRQHTRKRWGNEHGTKKKKKQINPLLFEIVPFNGTWLIIVIRLPVVHMIYILYIRVVRTYVVYRWWRTLKTQIPPPLRCLEMHGHQQKGRVA